MYTLGESRQRSLSWLWIYHSTFQVVVKARSVQSVTQPPIRVHDDYGLRRRMLLAVDVHSYFDLSEWDPSRRGGMPLCFRGFAVNYFETLKCSTSHRKQ